MLKAESGFGRRRALEIAIEVLQAPGYAYQKPLRKTRMYAARVLADLLLAYRVTDKNARAKRKKKAAEVR